MKPTAEQTKGNAAQTQTVVNADNEMTLDQLDQAAGGMSMMISLGSFAGEAAQSVANAVAEAAKKKPK